MPRSRMGARSVAPIAAGRPRRCVIRCWPSLARGMPTRPFLLDAIDKAATRTDFGRLWDCLLCFLERETARSYPDPALQLNVDLSHVSYVATANTLDGLPAHLLDRFRIAKFPKPLAGDLTRL